MPNQKGWLIFSGLGLVVQILILLDNLNGANAAECLTFPPWSCRRSNANEELRRLKVEIEEVLKEYQSIEQILEEQQQANDRNEIGDARYTVKGRFPYLDNSLKIMSSNEIAVPNFDDGIDEGEIEMASDLQNNFHMPDEFSSSRLND